MVPDALKLAERLEREERISVGVVNARFVKPNWKFFVANNFRSFVEFARVTF